MSEEWNGSFGDRDDIILALLNGTDGKVICLKAGVLSNPLSSQVWGTTRHSTSKIQCYC